MQPALLLLTSLACVSSLAIDKNFQAWDEGTRNWFSAVEHRRQGMKSKLDFDINVLIPDGVTCAKYSLSSAQMPTVSGLPPPSAGLTPYHIALGRGTQNYTCPPDNTTAVPTAIGAVATLYNISCEAAIHPDGSNAMPQGAIHMANPSQSSVLDPYQIELSGHHYFSNATTPTFNLNTAAAQYGIAFTKTLTKAPAPSMGADKVSTKGLEGEGAVPWLKLTVEDSPAPFFLTGDDDKGIKEVFRVNTQGGSAPATCADYNGGAGGAFEVQYAAEYWFYS